VLKHVLPEPFLFSIFWKCHPPKPFIAQGRVVYNEPPRPTGGPGVGEPYTVGQRLGVANDVFNDVSTLGLVACHAAFSHRYDAVPLRH
jgi:hypothetical protein